MPRSPLSPQQKRKIAEGKIAGKSQRQIAQDAGVSVSTVSHADGAIRSWMQRLAANEELRLSALYAKILETVLSDLEREKDLGKRQALRAEALRIIGLADGAVKQDRADEGQYTLTDLIKAYQRAVADES